MRYQAARVLRAAVSALLVLALLAGIPTALITVVGTPLPDRVTGLSDLVDRLSQPVTDPLLVRLLALVGWACWAVFATALGRECAWYLRRLPLLRSDAAIHRHHLAELPTHRAAAAVCVAAVVFALLHPLPTAHAVPRPAAVTPAAPAPAHGGGAVLPSSTAREQVEYCVQPGDTLWDIAQQHLGDPLRWPEIYKLNNPHRQADGHRLLDPDLLRPGWILTLPEHATAPRPAAPPAPRTRPDTAHAHAQAPDPAHAPSQPSRTAQGPESTVAQPSHIAPPPRPGPASRDSSPGRRHRPSSISVGEAGLIGVTAAAGIAAALAAVRRRRRPEDEEHQIELGPIVRAAQNAHVSTRAADESAPPTSAPATSRPDAESPRTAPSDGAADATKSHGSGTDTRTPGENRARPGGEFGDGELFRRRPAPASPGPPGAVSIGERNGSEIFLDALVHRQPLRIAGPGAVPFLRALLVGVLAAAERARPGPPPVHLAFSRAAENLVLPTQELLGGPEATAVALPGIRSLAEYRAERPEPRGTRPFAVAVTVKEEVAATTTRPDADVTLVLAEDGDETGLHVTEDGSTVVAATHLAGISGLRAHTLSPSDTSDAVVLFRSAQRRRPGPPPPPEPLPVPAPAAAPVETEPAPVRVSLAATTRALEDGPASDPTGPIAESAGSAAASSESGKTEAAGTAKKAVMVNLFGGFHIYAAGSKEIGQRLGGPARELMALLAAHRHGLRTEEIVELLRLDIRREETGKAIRNLRRAVRRALSAATGPVLAQFILTTDGRHRLNPALIDSDVEQMSACLRRSTRGAPPDRIAALREAVDLYRGRFVLDCDYPWADGLQESWHRKATAAAGALADQLAPTDAEQALAVLERSLEWDPADESASQRLLALQVRLGRDDAARRTYARLVRTLAELGELPSTDTVALLGRLHSMNAVR